MMLSRMVCAALALVALLAPPGAQGAALDGDPRPGDARGVLQCVPYAREVSGIRIYGDAHTWWGQAEGRYARGDRPRVGAVMNLRPAGNSRLGHVAAVSRVIDARTILIRHANWSSPGRIEDDVRAVDVSPGNDWSEVRVWFAPAGRLGARHWPTYGFIYNDRPDRMRGPDRRTGPEAAGSRRFADDPIGAIISARG